MRAAHLFAFIAFLSVPAFATPGNEVSGGALPLLPENERQTEEREVSGGALPSLPEPETPPVARDVGVDELPLLVDEPPQETPQSTAPDPVIGGQDSLLNPFAPLIVPQQPPQAAPNQPGQAQPTPPAAAEGGEAPTPPPVSEEAAPSAPTRAAGPSAPVPEAHLGTPSLPSALTERMQPPAAPAIQAPALLGAIATQDAVLGDPFATEAAIRTPSSLPPLVSPPTFAGAALVSQPAAGASRLSPLSLSQAMFGDDENATYGASNRVSRALASLRVSFTAMSTGTGIFRVGNSTQPVLVALGERLPGTGLTLSALTAQRAQFTEDDVRHTLLLNP